MSYLSWNEKTITDFSDENIESAYNDGYVFTRIGKGVMKQTRGLRIDLNKFELSSENKRILKKTEDLYLNISPVPYSQYTWHIHKMGKEFYEQKFGSKTPALNRPQGSGSVFSAQKIKELITDKEKSNFNRLFVYEVSSSAIGYCITLETQHILHYCYPFYELLPTHNALLSNMGMGMMLKAIRWAKEHNKKYIYLGSAQRPSDTYKLQFTGLEWFDGQHWKTDTDELKVILNNLNTEN